MRLRGILSVVALVLLAEPAVAHDGRAHSLEPGTWALMFRMGPDFQLAPFSGSTFGGKVQTSTRVAWRANLSLFAQDMDGHIVATPPDSLLESPAKDRSVQSVVTTIERQQYLTVGRDVNAYWTIGPRVEWVSFDDDFDAPAVIDDEYSRFGLGLVAELGGEWFATRRLGITAAYGVSAGWFRSEVTGATTTIPDVVGTRKSEGWTIGGAGAWLGLNVYF